MKAIKILIPMLCIALLFSGCGGFHLASSIDDLISPVAPAGADASVQSAMDAYCKGGYSVKIPAAGKYTTSYIFYDFDDDCQKEALAFYEPNDALGKIDMAVLEQSGENWQVIANIQGEGTDVYSVDFCDVNGDGKTEFLISWNMISYSTSHLMSVYKMTGSGQESKLTALAEPMQYSAYIPADLNNDGVQEVLATNGNTHLGGDDFDECVMNYLVSEFKKTEGIDLSNDKVAMQRLKEAAEKAKIELSGVTSTNINLPYITADATGPKHLDVTLTRAKFNELTAHLVEATAGPVKQAMADAGLSAGDISKVLLVGGSTRIPAVQDEVKKLTGKEGFKGINPDECVAVGAAIQGGVLGGDIKGLLLLDVTPLSLGIETMGGVFTKLIDRNTTIPTKKSQVFSTAADNQTSVEVHVLQGEREMAAYNKTLGKFQLTGIAPAPRGVPQIEVTFDIDANGIVNVSAKDLGTGAEQKITITASSNLSKEDIDKAVREAEQYAAEDKARKDEVDARNTADQVVYQSEKTLNEMGDKVSENDKAPVLAAIEKLKEAQKGTDVEAIKAATDEVQKAFYAVSEKLYQNAAPQGDPNAAGAAGGAQNHGAGDDGVVDADYEEVK